MNRLGAAQLNTMWSWCAVNDSERKVYFSIWTDMICRHNGEKAYIIQEPHWGVDEETGSKSAARNDQDSKFELVFERGYQAYGYFIVAKDASAKPRQIKETRTSFVVRLDIAKARDGSIVGSPRERVEVR